MGAAGRRGASPGFIYAPLGTIFSTLVGSPGARIGFSGTMDLRKLDWRFKRQLDFHFFKLPLACHGDLRFTNPLPARGAESVVAYLLFDDPACRLVVSGCSGFRPRAGASGCRDLQNLLGPWRPKLGSKQAFIFSCLGLRPIKVLLFAKLNRFFKPQRDFWGRWKPTFT